MKLRLVVLSLSFLSLIAVMIGAILSYSILKRTVLSESNRRAAADAAAVSSMFTAYLSENANSAKTLAGMQTIKKALLQTDPHAVSMANQMLDHFKKSLGTSVCYLMRYDGLTLASSNRHESGSFVGKNFSFRPYFQIAMQGDAAVYMALGTTSQKRGVYYSHPVYSGTQAAPAGVVVIKAGIDKIEAKAANTNTLDHGIWALTNDDGVIFSSNRKSWIFHFIGDPEIATRRRVITSRQFGTREMAALEFSRTGAYEMTDPDGERYLVHSKNIESMGQWKVMFFYKIQDALAVLTDPILKYRTPFIMVTCLIFSVIIFTLSSIALLDIRERRKKREALALQNAYLSALHETTLGLIGRLDINELMGAVLSHAGTLTGTEDGFLYLYDARTDELELMVGLGIYKDEVGRCVKPGQGLAGQIYKTGAPLCLDDYSVWPDRLPQRKYDNLHAVVGLPLKRRTSIAGVMGLGHFEPGKVFSEDQIKIIERFCQLSVIALDNAQLHSRLQNELKERQSAQKALKRANLELERLARMDGLTKIANRRWFDETLLGEWKRLCRSTASIALILADVDFFKRYNDTYGHQAGDHCLQAVAKAISASVYRPSDMAARFGGEEFAVLLPETDLAGARLVGVRIQENIEKLNIPHKTSDIDSRVTLSLGISCMTAGIDVDPTLLVQFADEALYEAKSGGRNKMVLQTERVA